MTAMTLLVLGLVLFLGVHSVRLVADDWRSAMVARLGLNGWKGVYTLLSVAGLALVVIGFGQVRAQPTLLWVPPIWMRHLASLLNLAALIMIVAAYVPGNHIKAKLGHPMVLGVKVWALAHLVSNQMLSELILFGAFAVWAVFEFRGLRARDRAAGTTYPAGRAGPTAVAVLVGTALWAALAFWGHGVLFGVKPFGG
jgi:uncharacterized membrane protein